MIISKDSTVHDLLDEHPFLLEFLAQYDPKFGLLRNPVARATLGRLATLDKVAGIGGVPVEKLVADLDCAIGEHDAGDRAANSARVACGMAVRETAAPGGRRQLLPMIEPPAPSRGGVDPDPARVATLKGIIKSLHDGEALPIAKARFDATFSAVSHGEIVAMEEQLMREGTRPDEIKRLCDVHVAVVRSRLDAHAAHQVVPPGHPADTYRAENAALAEACAELRSAARMPAAPLRGDGSGDAASRWATVGEAVERVAQIERHYLRKEYQLFPCLERHGITGPSQVMWGIHDETRALVKELRVAIERADAGGVAACVPMVTQAISDMIFKEENILLPMALQTLDEEEWARIAAGEQEFGYALVQPRAIWPIASASPAFTPALPAGTDDQARAGVVSPAPAGAALPVRTGRLTLEQLNLVLSHLPVDVTFVDERDEVAYFSDTPDRIFPRTPEIIGRKVQLCHPPKSLHAVNRILADFRGGQRDVAEFWIQMKGRMVHIRYFAVRDQDGRYRGTLEVTQDVTDIKRLDGERRLLDLA